MYDDIYQSLFEIVTFFNRPQQDGKLLSRAGVQLDKTLFPILMTIQHTQPIGLVELAHNVNKNYTTLSRQVDVLVDLGLVHTSPAPHDKRMRHISLANEGKKMIETIADARRAMMSEHLQGWGEGDKIQLKEVLGKLADSLTK